jgi:hypothetical protein
VVSKGAESVPAFRFGGMIGRVLSLASMIIPERYALKETPKPPKRLKSTGVRNEEAKLKMVNLRPTQTDSGQFQGGPEKYRDLHVGDFEPIRAGK